MTELFDEDRASWGYVPNFTRTFALRPDVYRAWQQLLTAIKSTMDGRRYELATVAAAASSFSTTARPPRWTTPSAPWWPSPRSSHGTPTFGSRG
ncbi:MAG: hypothetical protein GEV03_23815 [Streptosporangiales bacterium]|nr:hypothetical protein [Streptosporangiales bacterium]